jgi:hypothetical protein
LCGGLLGRFDNLLSRPLAHCITPRENVPGASCCHLLVDAIGGLSRKTRFAGSPARRRRGRSFPTAQQNLTRTTPASRPPVEV